jgi:1-acyl-sn-glycerol-3-phosphate acyltransferase
MLAVLRFLVRVLTRLRVEGLEHVPPQGACLIVSNHLHYLDAVVVGVTVPRRCWTLAAEKYEGHLFFGTILKIAGAIFIDRGEVDRGALRQAFNVLEDGYGMAVAVEGTRSKTGALARGKTGAAYLATRTGAPLVPVVVWGTEQIVPAWKRLRRAEVRIVYGPPFYLPEGRARTADLETYTDEIMVTLARMLPEKYRGVYADHPLLQERPAAAPIDPAALS